MDIEESSVPYRAFLRSGSYPALTQRVIRSGGVLAQAAGWFALVVTAASAGYNLTQRLATPSAASVSQQVVRSAARTTPEPKPARARAIDERPETLALRDGFATSEQRPSVARASLAMAVLPMGMAAPAPAPAPARKRTGAVLQPAAAQESEATVEVTTDLTEPVRAEQLAERVRALHAEPEPEIEPQPEPVQHAVLPDPIEAVLRDSAERHRVAPPVVKAPARVAPKPAPVEPAAPSQPLTAAARIDGVNVRGPLSAAQLRRSVDRVRPTLSDCYAEAARRAGVNRFSQVRVNVTIDEAGRVKTQPQVEGAQLPGLDGCVSTAMSKLVCQAPDTGTAKAQIVLGFVAQR